MTTRGILPVAACACMLVAFGCTTVVTPPARTAQPVMSANAHVMLAPQLAAPMRRVTLELVRAGLAPDPHAFAGFLPNGNHATFPIHVQAKTCATIIAMATKSVGDVDAALYTPDGELLVIDAEPDPHPTLQVCADSEARDLYYVIQLYDGDGSFVVLPFYGTRATLAAVARVVGGRPAFAEAGRPRELLEDPLASLRVGMRKRGFTPASEPVVFSIAERERVRSALPTESATCYTIAAFGSGGLHELGLRVFDDRGNQLAVGDGVRGQAAMQLCVRQRASYTVETEAQSGSGRVTLVVFRADVVVAGGDAGLWLGHRDAAKANADAASVAEHH